MDGRRASGFIILSFGLISACGAGAMDWRAGMKPKNAAVYVRVSTTDQHTDLQETELRKYCEHRGWQYRVYRDAGQSGAKDNRPALTEMMQHIRQRKVDVIVILGAGSAGAFTETPAHNRRRMQNTWGRYRLPEAVH
jgi:Resolvase, N terminal domain